MKIRNLKSEIRNGFTLVELPAMSKRGFTLVELLVVITIIVVLLALLVPAMDKAIYQAELAVCGAKLKAMGSGVMTYAMDFGRRYPYRAAFELQPPPGGWQPHFLSNGLGAYTVGWPVPQLVGSRDDRKLLRQRFSLNDFFNCPLNSKVDIEGSKPETWIWGSYSLWFGWEYRGQKRMSKLGDAFSWAGTDYRLLASDHQTLNPGYNNCTHPDRDGLLTNVRYQDEYVTITNVTAGTSTVSWWQGADRSPVDLNYAYDDGSVIRHDHILTTGANDARGDKRFDSAPASTDPTAGPWPAKYTLLPRR